MCFGKSRKEQCDIQKLYEIQISVSINSFIGIQPKIVSWPFMVKFAEPGLEETGFYISGRNLRYI